MPAPSGNDPPFDLGAYLEATEEVRTQRFTIYIPDRDRANQPIENIEDWIAACMGLLTRINGGCTRLPNASGEWLSDEGVTVKEQTALIYSFFGDASVFVGHLNKIRAFIHRFGKETNQGEVMVELFGEDAEGLYSRAYKIKRDAWQG